jgi:hypothetical protein
MKHDETGKIIWNNTSVPADKFPGDIGNYPESFIIEKLFKGK